MAAVVSLAERRAAQVVRRAALKARWVINWRLVLALAFTVGGWASCTAIAWQVTR